MIISKLELRYSLLAFVFYWVVIPKATAGFMMFSFDSKLVKILPSKHWLTSQHYQFFNCSKPKFVGESPDSSEVLIKAVLYLHTKDIQKVSLGDTLFVKVTSPSGRRIAYLKSPVERRLLVNNSNIQHVLVIDARGINKAEALGFSVYLERQSKKNYTWEFDARMELYFSDGYIIAGEEHDTFDKNKGTLTFNSF